MSDGEVPTTHVRLVDPPDRPGRTTVNLLGSLASRLGTLHLVTGADAVGAMTAGLAKLGREVAGTVDGKRFLEAISAGRAGANGDAIWDSLRIGEWASSLPPSPLLDHVRNDLALLLAADLETALAGPLAPADAAGAEGGPVAEPATFPHYLLGLWTFAREVLTAIDALLETTLPEAGRVVPGGSAPEIR